MSDKDILAEIIKSRKLIIKNACLLWNDKLHYGMISAKGLSIGAHRAAWIVKNGDIPKGLMVLHTCDNRPCINTDHLYLGTAANNMRDCINRGRHQEIKKTHCEKGHPFSGDNLRITLQGERRCKICKDNWNKERKLLTRVRKDYMEKFERVAKAAKEFDLEVHCYPTGVSVLLEPRMRPKHVELMEALADLEKGAV